MPYTVEDGGRLNNFASEPKMYAAEPPTQKQRVVYIALGVGAMALIVGMVVVAVLVS